MEEYTKIIEELRTHEKVRENLSRMRSFLREMKTSRQAQGESGLVSENQARILEELEVLCREFLREEDSKVRKNSALLLGDLEAFSESMADSAIENVRLLWAAYVQETTLFVKSAYLKALEQYPKEALEILGESVLAKWEELQNAQYAEDAAKHIRQERMALGAVKRKIFGKEKTEKSECIFPHGKLRLLLCCESGIRKKLAEKMKPLCSEVNILASGVAVTTTCTQRVLENRLYREAWVIARQKKNCTAHRSRLAKALAASELLPILRSCYPQNTSFAFRLRLLGADDLKRKADFVQRTAFALEEESGGLLKNQPEDYEAEIILKEKRDGAFAIFVKIMGWKDERFSYRKNVQPTSMHPAAAAAMLALAETYLKDEGQVLDPFCGVGTLLVERAYFKKAGYMYGTDVFGDAVNDGRKNVQLAFDRSDSEKDGFGKGGFPEVYLINRDYFDFTSEYLFDEIITEFPHFYGKSIAEKNVFFQKFFTKSTELLREEGVLIFLTEEENQVKKQIRLSKELCLERQMEFRGRENVYVVKKRQSRCTTANAPQTK